ncbi:MAG: DUF2283 domain-containing protein [Anaerolineae bacterium]|nr:DUF2283 domain-containing protein [Anaerolineae bacterium]
MKITYDARLDILRIILNDSPIAESDEDKSGMILDYDEHGQVVGVEILDASTRVNNPVGVEYSVIGME